MKKTETTIDALNLAAITPVGSNTRKPRPRSKASAPDGHWSNTPVADDHPGYRPFWAWVAQKRAAVVTRPLSDKSAVHYSHIWRAWLRFLESRQPLVEWADANSTDVEEFLRAIVPAATSRSSLPASATTRARYRSLLKHVYSLAVAQARTCGLDKPAADPTGGVTVSEDLPDKEKSQTLVPTREMWRCFVDHLATLPSDPSGSRTKAIVSLIMDGALTVSDLLKLQMRHVIYAEQAEDRITARVDPEALLMDAGEDGKGQRELHLSSRCSNALASWLLDRSELAPRSSKYVFIALARNKRLTAKAIFEIVRDFMESAKPRSATWDELLTRGGPNLLRNGCIKRMIEGQLPFELIFHVLGVKPKALERFLPHCTEAARSRYELELAQARAEAKQP